MLCPTFAAMAQRIEILYDDSDLVMVNKPSGMLTIPDRHDPSLPSLRRLAQAQLGQELWIVHRLDRDTSGVVCFAKNEAAHRHVSILFQNHEVTKFYAGLVHGRVSPESGRIEAPIAPDPSQAGKMMVSRSGKMAVTDYRVTAQWPLYALLQLQIHTGRTHQIRVHMRHLGHSIVGDKLYGDGQPLLLSAFKKKFRLSTKDEEERPLLNRLALHAYELSFEKADGTLVKGEAPLPKDMAVAVKQLDKWS